LTGLMPARNGAEANHSKPRQELKKLPAYLQELGYEVVAFGKVSHYRHTGDYGFDHFGNDKFHDPEVLPAALQYLRDRKSSQPLCLFVGTNWPHVPWPEKHEGYDPATVTIPPTHVDTPVTREARAAYYAAITRMDRDLGQIYDATRERLGENTVFIHTSDHGGQWPFGKWNCYDAGIRVPLIVSWPGKIKPKQSTEAMVSWVDILPTLVKLAGGKPPTDLDGLSFAGVLHDPKATHRFQIFATHTGDGNMNVYPMRCVRTREWKYILNIHPEFQHTTHIDLAAPRDGRGYFDSWRALAKTEPRAAAAVERYHRRDREELYDLSADPYEQRNLASDPRHAERLASLRADLDKWMRDLGDAQRVLGTPRVWK
jgi:N-sulfoglucosamine sulfohydrolase